MRADLNAGGQSSPLRGVLLLACAVLLFASMDATTKVLAASYAVPLIVAARYLGHLLLMLVFVAPQRGMRLLHTRRTGLVIVRALSLVVASLFAALALQRMPLAECTAIIFLAPLLVVILAGPVLGERIGAVGWIAALLGFAGVLLIVRPGSGLDPVAVGYLLVNVAATTTYLLLSRLLSASESTTSMLFYVALAGSICFGAILPWSLGGATPSALELALFCSMGLTGGVGHFLFTSAFRYAPASVLAPINYLQLVWASVLGLAIFQHVPDATSLTGMAVVAASGVMVAVKSAREARSPTVPIDD